MGPSLIPVFFSNNEDFFFNHPEEQLTVCKDRLVFGDLLLQFCILGFDLLSFQSGQGSQTHVHDRLSLHVGKFEALHQFTLGDLDRLGPADDADDFVNIIEGDEQAFQDVSPLFRFVEVVFCTSRYNFFLMLEVIFQHIKKIHDLRLIVYKGQHDHAECILKLCVFVKLVQDHVRIHISSQFDADPHSLTAGLIAQVCNAVDPFISYKLCNLLDQSCFVDHERKLGHDDPVLSVCHGLDICDGAHADLAASCAVRFLDASCPKDLRTGREVRSLDDLHDILNGRFAVLIDLVIDDLYHRADDFS